MELSEILRNDLVHFTQTLKVDEELCSYMLQGRVLSVGNVDDITSKPSVYGRNAEFIKIVSTRGERGKHVLVEALVATSQLDLAYKVDHALAEKHEIAAYGSSTAEQYPVREKQMNTLSGRSRSGDRGKPDAYSGGHQSNYETDHGLSAPVRQTTTDHSHQETERILDFHEYMRSKINLSFTELSKQDPIITTMKTGRDDIYKVKPQHSRGMAFIISNTDFVNEPSRSGSDKDLDNLREMLDSLGFTSLLEENLKSNEMIEQIRDWRSYSDFSEVDVCLICVMSHGDSGSVSGSDDKPVNIQQDILRPFQADQCPELSGKPKVVLIQACQGSKFTPGVSDADHSDSAPAAFDATAESVSRVTNIHPEQDFLVAYSTSPGYVAYREEELGTWFIRAFILEMYKHCHKEHLADIMTKVTATVSRFRSYSLQSEFNNGLQLPFYQSQLKKKLFLCVPKGL